MSKSLVQDYVTFPPSYAHIWGAPDGCPTFPHALRAYPRTSSDAADEGKKAHALAGVMIPPYVSTGVITAPDCNDAEMVTHVSSYVRAVLTDGQSSKPGVSKHGVETQLILRNIHERCKGYVDFFWWSETELSVWDFKYGFGPVEAFRNWQLVAYASTLLRMKGFGPDNWPEGFTVRLNIHQPRAPHPDGAHRVWKTDPGVIFEMEAQLAEAARIASSGEPFTRSGHHCLNCPARLDCPAARKSELAALAYIERPTQEQYTPEQIGYELVLLERASEAIETRLSAARAEVTKLLEKGEQITTWRHADSESRMFWKDGDTSGKALAALGYQDVLNPAKPCTPKQAIDKGVPPDVVKVFAKRNKGKKLVRQHSDWAAKELAATLAGK